MSKTVEVPDISYWEENDSEKVKYVVTYLLNDIKELKRKNELLNINVEDLQEKITKAIEYIESYHNTALCESDKENLIKILRGE